MKVICNHTSRRLKNKILILTVIKKLQYLSNAVTILDDAATYSVFVFKSGMVEKHTESQYRRILT